MGGWSVGWVVFAGMVLSMVIVGSVLYTHPPSNTYGHRSASGGNGDPTLFLKRQARRDVAWDSKEEESPFPFQNNDARFQNAVSRDSNTNSINNDKDDDDDDDDAPPPPGLPYPSFPSGVLHPTQVTTIAHANSRIGERWHELLLFSERVRVQSEPQYGDTTLRDGEDTRIFHGPAGFCSFSHTALSATTTVIFIKNATLRAIAQQAATSFCQISPLDPVLQGNAASDYEDEPTVDIYDTTMSRAQLMKWVDIPSWKYICKCFHRNRLPIFADPNAFPSHKVLMGHTLAFEQFHRDGHHWGHFVEQMGMTFSFFKSHESSYFGPMHRLFFLKTSYLTPQEQDFASIALSPLGLDGQVLLNSALYRNVDFESGDTQNPGSARVHYTWMERATIPMSTSLLASSPENAQALRVAANKYFGWRVPSGCPPTRIAVLRREIALGRNIENEAAVANIIFQRTSTWPEAFTITEFHSLKEQATFFRSFGVILAPHSSQLVSMLFAHPQATVVEMVPVVYNWDFANMATLLGLEYRMAVGGTPHFVTSKDANPGSAVMASLQKMAACGGDVSCIRGVDFCVDLSRKHAFRLGSEVERGCARYKKASKAAPSYDADITGFTATLDAAVQRIQSLPSCSTDSPSAAWTRQITATEQRKAATIVKN